ncbi:MAG: GGDEF domain-containing protein [Fimbriimonadaceae bacterium]
MQVQETADLNAWDAVSVGDAQSKIKPLISLIFSLVDSVKLQMISPNGAESRKLNAALDELSETLLSRTLSEAEINSLREDAAVAAHQHGVWQKRVIGELQLETAEAAKELIAGINPVLQGQADSTKRLEVLCEQIRAAAGDRPGSAMETALADLTRHIQSEVQRTNRLRADREATSAFIERNSGLNDPDSSTDALTGLMSTASYMNLLSANVRSARGEHSLAILNILNYVEFQSQNGVQITCDLLAMISQSLQAEFGEGFAIGKLKGDEFVVSGQANVEAMGQAVFKIVEALNAKQMKNKAQVSVFAGVVDISECFDASEAIESGRIASFRAQQNRVHPSL